MHAGADERRGAPTPAVESATILLVEESAADTRRIRDMLSATPCSHCQLKEVGRLSAALEMIDSNGVDVILLNPSLPDSQALDALARVCARAPRVPILVLADHPDENAAVEGLRTGTQDYLVKGELEPAGLHRAILYAMERHQIRHRLLTWALMDELTALLNRRGFKTMAERQAPMAVRMNKPVFLLFADLDRMKWINDTFGHLAGDRALREVADFLKETFRDSDVVARVGGDEFAVLGIETGTPFEENISSRLREGLGAQAADKNLPYDLSLSVGLAHQQPDGDFRVDELLSHADKDMYKVKQAHHGDEQPEA